MTPKLFGVTLLFAALTLNVVIADELEYTAGKLYSYTYKARSITSDTKENQILRKSGSGTTVSSE